MNPTDLILLVGSVLMLAGILAGKVGTRLGVPALLVFLITGMLFGSAGLGLEYNDTKLTQFAGTIALAIILFCGGFETKVSEIRPVFAPGIMLSTVGVLLTTLFFGAFLYWLGTFSFFTIHLSFPIALLLAATMSSTDSASVFGLLRSNNMHLKEGMKPMLELESGSNDPMAYMLTIALIQYIMGDGSGTAWEILFTFLMQFGVGSLMGYLMGRLSVLFINKMNIDNEALYPITLLCGIFLTYASTTLLMGNGFLAVYIMGLVAGNRKLVHKKSTMTFFDGTTWLVQIGLFILLGLYVDAQSLLTVAPYALLASVFMILVARPLATFISLSIFPSISLRGKTFLSWVGLRGAVPIIFATYPQMANVEGADTLFSIVFFITLVSLLVQGSTLPLVARWLGLDEEVQQEVSLFGVEIPQHTGTSMEERLVTTAMVSEGNRLMDLDLADDELVILVRRGDDYLVPKGKLEIHVQDVLLIVSEQKEGLHQ
ncbi:MAG: potassium/proton antiporter [Porphyromonas sp.]|nr:potassium/proton antiporter [Porphyromonas sp.]